MSAPSNIRVLALDVDGVLTNGTIAFTGLIGHGNKIISCA